PAFEWVHVQLHQQKGMISLSPPTICNSADRCYLDAQKVSEARWFENNKEYEKSINKWRDVFGPFFPVYG
ncbi:hypothetical protein SND88_04210, partial [Escherichia coli]|nr:hypothetical protein [Escherichia coli]